MVSRVPRLSTGGADFPDHVISIDTLIGPARDCMVPRELRFELAPEQRAGKPLWAYDEAFDVIDAMEAAGAAVVQGELVRVADDGEVIRIPWEPLPGIPDPIYQPWARRWRCRRQDDEGWGAWVARAAAYARTMARRLAREALGTSDGPVHVDLAWAMEDELALYDVPGWEQRQQRRVIEHGGGEKAWMIPWLTRMDSAGEGAPGSYYGPSAMDVAEIPGYARYASVSGSTGNRERVAELTSLEMLGAGAWPQEALPHIGRLPRLRVLYLNDIYLSSLEPLDGLSALEFAYVDGGSRLGGPGPLGELPALRYLHLWAPGMRDLAPLAALTQVNSLHVAPATVVDSLAPLAGLHDLRYLSVRCARVRDGGVAPLARLRGLRSLDAVPSRLSLEERAWLAAALPHTEGPHRSPLLPGNAYGSEKRCPRCDGRDVYLTAGPRRRRLCAACDAGAIRRHVARWESLLSAATAAARGRSSGAG